MTLPLTIFGSGGFIGATLCTSLDARGFSSKDADFSDAGQVNALAGAVSPSSVWLIAAARSPDWSGTAVEGMRSNLVLAANLADLVSRTVPRYVIYLSTIDVYGREDLALPLSESSPVRPSSYYGISKHASEGILTLACKEAGIPFTVLRLPGVYGPGDTHWGPVHSFLDAAVRRAPITIHGNGEQQRDLLFVRDIPKVVQALCETPIPGVFNLVTGRSVRLNDMLHIIEQLTGKTLQVHYKHDRPQFDIVFETPPLLLRAIPLTFTPIEEGVRKTYTALAGT